MTKQCLLLSFLALLTVSILPIAAQQRGPDGKVIHKVVDLVQLNIAVTNGKGHYVTGLKPSDFKITEDDTPQRIATFGEGNKAPRAVFKYASGARTAPQAVLHSTMAADHTQDSDLSSGENATWAQATSPLAGASVFILFDTSNYMFPHRGFVYAQDSIAQFVSTLQGPDRIAFYSYSRNLTRAISLTNNREAVLRGVRSTVNGDDAALYDALLLTLKDASQYTGRKVVVVFSNGPDNSSMIAPENVDELAQSEGIPIYMVSTQQSRFDPVSSAAFSRISASTGGEAFFGRNWKDQRYAFTAIQDDLAHLYLVSYYPQPNPNSGWRKIKVTLVGKAFRKYHIRTRSGYRPLPAGATAQIPQTR